VSCEDRPFFFREILSKLLYFSDRGHGAIIVRYRAEASEPHAVVG
jgi:hypothetical protein